MKEDEGEDEDDGLAEGVDRLRGKFEPLAGTGSVSWSPLGVSCGLMQALGGLLGCFSGSLCKPLGVVCVSPGHIQAHPRLSH